MCSGIFFKYLFYVYKCFSCMYVCLCTTLEGLKRSLDHLKLELGMIVSHNVGAEN